MNQREKVIGEAFRALENSYAPYSGYHVGAAVLTSDGRVFHGVNIENASYGATNCAERSAVFAAYSYGYRKETIVSLAIVCDGPRPAAPCGICRQVLSELVGPQMPIYLANRTESLVTNMRELLPMAFTEEDVKG